MRNILLFVLLYTSALGAKPYHDPAKVDSPKIKMIKNLDPAEPIKALSGTDVLRVEVQWSEGEKYSVDGLYLEKSGTEGLRRSALRIDRLGSFKAKLSLTNSDGEQVFFSSIGTGREFRQLSRKLSFRFPIPSEVLAAKLILEAEHPETGEMQKVLEKNLQLTKIVSVEAQPVKISLLKKASKMPAIKVVFYAEGFDDQGEAKFLDAARRALATFESQLPGSEFFEYSMVFATSNQKIGSATDFGPEVKIRDSFLSLYFPHWRKFGRWYHVVYPTDQTRYRNALAQTPYDYPVALVDDDGYWGVGNYKELTAVPIKTSQFSYLLMHEFGHFMGLNEEYEGGGPTELEFAPGIKEPWSQNITFNPDSENLKWRKHISPGISLPTSQADYQRHGGSQKNPVGAYRGGYADSLPANRSHKPVMKCMMSTGGDFCPVCSDGLRTLIQHDRGEDP